MLFFFGFFFFYKTLKQINKTSMQCSREHRECVLPGRGHFFRHYERINFATKQIKLAKNLMLKQKCLCNKQMLIRYHEKLNLSAQKYWKDKMEGLQNIKCIPLGGASRFHLFLMVAEICCEMRFRRSRNTLYVSVRDEHFFFLYDNQDKIA